MNGKVKIIGYTNEPDRITASGARISTTMGDSLAIFENATNTEKNQELVKKVLKSGHKSLIEHINFNLAFINVSAYVEQLCLSLDLLLSLLNQDVMWILVIWGLLVHLL